MERKVTDTKKPSIEIGHLNDDNVLVVHCITEHEDGSADIDLTLGKETMRMLIQVGFFTILKHGLHKDIENLEAKHNG